MIRLIASDMDGTLLDDEKRLPKDFFSILDALFERGITFAVSSGRTYSALEHLFPEEYVSRMSFICDNGACTVINGKIVNVSEISRSVYEELLVACADIGGLTPVVCAESGVFHQKSDEDFFDEVGIYYKNHMVVDDLRTVEGMVYKLAVYDEGDALAHGKKALDARFGEQLSVLVSGVEWMDVMAGGVSKGRALKKLQQSLGVSREETMAFGDYFNDLDMLQAADWSFCMENGHEEIKKQCRFIAPSNNEGGVTQSIRKFVLT